MKQSKFNPRYVTAVAIASFAALVSACGSSGSTAAGIGVGVGGIGGVGSQCVPLSQQMSFSGYAAYLDSANIYAGSQYGSQLGMGQGGATSGNQLINTVMPPVDQYAPRTTSDLTYMGMNITSTGYTGSYLPTTGINYTGTYPTTGYPSTGYPSTGYGTGSNQTMIQGSFVIAAADWQILMTQFQQYGGYGQYGTYPVTSTTTLQNVQACNLSINSGIYSWNTGQGQGTLYGGYITMTIGGQPYKFQI
jgi:hypothetical protein